MMTIAVCDNDIIFADNLAAELTKLKDKKLPSRIPCEIVPAFYSAEQVLNYICTESKHISVLFLDIDMPECSGFELAEKLSKLCPDIIIVFVSAYENFVYSSFDYSPFRFLRKTYISSELPNTFDRLIEKYIYSLESIDIQTVSGGKSIPIKEIVYFESKGNYFNVCCLHNTYRCRGTIKDAERMIKDYDFYRIHAAFVANMQNIESFNKNQAVLMKNGVLLYISQKRMKDFKKVYSDYIRRKVR